ncbi:hypothetical protein Tco_0770944 [Tanacetum coccineum]|uniref:Uncharacterized protein n=1 Tax=Tanacetum coccineum TaxID=301880 RepID=A0ABQ4ZHD6_9ASTR
MYQVFEDMFKNFDKDDLVKLWSLVQERYNSSRLTEDKEIELWVELKMLFEPYAENLLELQKYMHDPLKWWLYEICAVHHVSTEKGQDIFMLVEKDYLLIKGLATLMLSEYIRRNLRFNGKSQVQGRQNGSLICCIVWKMMLKFIMIFGMRIERTKLSTARPKLSTDSTKIESMKLEAMVEERRIFKCWFHYHTTNGHQFTMSNRHQELASLEQTASALAIPEQTATGKEISNPFMAGSDDENPPPPPPPQTPTQQAPHTVSTIKLPILKKGEYDIWAMKMEHYLSHTNYPIWEVIQKGNGPVSVSTDTNGVIKVLPPKTAKEILARERERKARTTLLMALPEDHLAKFHKMTDAKEMWDAIKSRFFGNDESKKMQKYILKQQFEGFSVSNSEGLHKGYDRFQSLLSQFEIHGAGVSTKDANQKFLRVIESNVKGSTRSSSSAQNVSFVSSESTSSTNDVSTAYSVSTSSGYNP